MDRLIASFQVDHTRIGYGSRRDVVNGAYITTFDVRMKRPNAEPAIHPNAVHTIEHIVATYLRNSKFKDHVVYWGPMGCLTGCYLIVKGRPEPQEIAKLLKRAFSFAAAYEGEVPGATAVNCGNYLLHDLQIAKYEPARYADILADGAAFEYPQKERIETKEGLKFFDS